MFIITINYIFINRLNSGERKKAFAFLCELSVNTRKPNSDSYAGEITIQCAVKCETKFKIMSKCVTLKKFKNKDKNSI